MAPIPITIITGFLGSGKTTLILNLIPQLPPRYKLALLKNEFGDVAIDTKLASNASISGVQELLNGCICCNLVGQLGDALSDLRKDVAPDRIIVETSGSAFPATLAMEVNRLGKETGDYVLDGVVSVIDVENWKGYDDTSYTAKIQARYTDLIIFNKWEHCDERRFDECLDRVADLEVDTAWVKSDKGVVAKDLVVGIDSGLARELQVSTDGHAHNHDHQHDDTKAHQSEVNVLSVTLGAPKQPASVNLEKLEELLLAAPKDEVYRIKAVVASNQVPKSSTGDLAGSETELSGHLNEYILNWAFGRWTFTPIAPNALQDVRTTALPTPPDSSRASPAPSTEEPALRMTVILARDEAVKWQKRIENSGYLRLSNVSPEETSLKIERMI
ncbi:CobW/HypB/UreG, nucleotide-binding domain-containing protein [Xylona heveae TC161]|uniref:CobW/HypB/UreG, nucleotide-binding domain-containing protein n=1 Tax=Xylona heveae (strain CBS 132557 / TC161) TaxID=1328760 RepID=A0A165IDY5_XYLHT|nr:CobW/HypB/UreG, nucleotide-binding domain-containing protein [Xylona heveae TC161]KZF24758.1 CobW/HypB/UreG, nucleotide-binding domain-containing protein [Xylona heveae TC161]